MGMTCVWFSQAYMFHTLGAGGSNRIIDSGVA